MDTNARIVKETIPAKLREIEEKENIRIIHAVESGSRAWGFASPDSDYDVRFIYVRPIEYYLRLDKTKDVIEWQLDETLDINGWDIKKVLTLLHKSNPTLFEWASSPIVYKSTPDWEEICGEINSCFRKKSGLFHYLYTAKRNYKEFLCGENVKLKKYFYVLRPILACRWIIDKETPPPMLFSVLADNYLKGEISEEVSSLLERKRNTPELGKEKRIEKINKYLESSIEEVEALLEALPPDSPPDWDTLNKIFFRIVNKSS